MKGPPKNVVGPVVAKLRVLNVWTQEELAAKLRAIGWEQVKRSWLSKIENGEVAVRDVQIGYFLQVFGPVSEDLFWRKLSPWQSDNRAEES